MSGPQVTLLASELADWLYHVRFALEGGARRTLYASHLEEVHVVLTLTLRNLGYDPGRTAMEADALKLSLMAQERP